MDGGPLVVAENEYVDDPALIRKSKLFNRDILTEKREY
jgi:hypothetical protein